MRKNKKLMITVVAIAIILLSIVGSYAFFTSVINNDNKTTAELNTATLSLTFSDNDNGINERLMFGESVTKKFAITNTGTRDASLSLDWDKLVNTYMDGSLSFNLSYGIKEAENYTEIISETNMPTSNEPLTQTLAGELSVPAGETYYYNLTITLNNLKNIDQSSDKNAIFHTKFDVNKPIKYRYYTLTVDPNGGTWGEFTGAQQYLLQNNDTMELKGTPVRTGHTFAGWKLKGVSSTFESGLFTMGISDAVLTAKWGVNQYTLTIDTKGGVYDGATSIEMDYGSSITLKTPVKEGYTFTGWTVSSGSLNDNEFTMNETKNATVTANWQVNTYNCKVIHRQMNVSGNGYDVIDTETVPLEYGETFAPKVNTYVGFTSPGAKTVTVKVDSEDPTKNVITYDYTRNKYDLTIKPAGGKYNNSTADVTEKLYYGATLTVNDPVKEGHTFTNWTVSSGLLEGSTFTIGASDAKLTANYTPNDYKYIVYHEQQNINDNNYTRVDAETDNGTAKFGTTVTPPVKTFTGFTSPGASGLTIQIDNNVPPTLNVKNYKYTRNSYNLTLDLDGGTGLTSPISMKYQEQKTLETPTKTGYTFNKWTIASGSGTLNGSVFTMGSGATTVKATYTINQYDYTVQHKKMNTSGTYTTVDETESLSANYNTSVSGTAKSYTGFGAGTCTTITVETDTSKNVVECKYPRNQYTLTINNNNGTANSTLNLYYEASTTLTVPSKTGYTFTSWSATSGTVSGNTFTMGTSDTTVTAGYKANTYDVTFNANGGTTPTQSKTVTYDSTYGTLPTPTRTGYNFEGWFTATSGGTQIASGTIVKITSKQTLYAHWKVIVGTDVTLARLQVTPKIGTPEFTQTATTDEGVYSMPDDYGTSYYYRGNVTKNYVKFANMFWRIIRVNGDGSIRMIYDGPQAYANGISNINRLALTDIVWNSNYNDAKYIGYMYGGINGSASINKNQAQTNTTNSNAKIQVESWYKTNIYDKGYAKFVSDEIFCNDRTTPGYNITEWTSDTGLGYGKNVTGYGTLSRFLTGKNSPSLYPKTTLKPIFTCPQKNDSYTVDDEIKGNGMLNYPVGFITLDEVVAAGSGGLLTANPNYYLYKGAWYWTLSPSAMDTNGSSSMFNVGDNGSMSSYYVNDKGGIAPVINLSPETSATLKGTGTMSDPFALS